MSFPIHPSKIESLPTDLHYRGILLSAIYAGFKDGPKNSFNVQPVVL